MERTERGWIRWLSLGALLALLLAPGCIAGISGEDSPAQSSTSNPPVIRGQIVPPGDAADQQP